MACTPHSAARRATSRYHVRFIRRRRHSAECHCCKGYYMPTGEPRRQQRLMTRRAVIASLTRRGRRLRAAADAEGRSRAPARRQHRRALPRPQVIELEGRAKERSHQKFHHLASSSHGASPVVNATATHHHRSSSPRCCASSAVPTFLRGRCQGRGEAILSTIPGDGRRRFAATISPQPPLVGLIHTHARGNYRTGRVAALAHDAADADDVYYYSITTKPQATAQAPSRHFRLIYRRFSTGARQPFLVGFLARISPVLLRADWPGTIGGLGQRGRAILCYDFIDMPLRCHRRSRAQTSLLERDANRLHRTEAAAKHYERSAGAFTRLLPFQALILPSRRASTFGIPARK